jgi:pimeloyl-ACP methyl ester carboxylesterase
MGRFHLLRDTGHMPHLETPERTLDAISASAGR